MEINFENKLIGSYREILHRQKRIQESAESVVPDVSDDIGSIASVQTSVLLKSKDISSRGVRISGEACACLLYITESEKSVSFLRLSKPFAIEYEAPDLEADTAAQINLQISNAEARVLNPRKVSVTFEITGELSCYRQELMEAETILPEENMKGVHVKFESAQSEYPNAVCEKPFVINEQYSFPSAKPAACALVYERPEFSIEDTQLIGTKLILKGSLSIDCCYMSEEANYPIRTAFSSPFSQIIDIAQEKMDSCSVIISLNSAYFELTDSINGEKVLDAEIHALIQLVSRSNESISYISDAYSNVMPAKCNVKTAQLCKVSGMEKIRLASDESISIAGDCADVLGIFPSTTQSGVDQGKITAAVSLDILYESTGGSLSAVKRSVNLSQDCREQDCRVLGARPEDINLRPEGDRLTGRVGAEICCQSISIRELRRVTGLVLDEENKYDMSTVPGINLVRQEGESLWELAKQYHSSVESIESLISEQEEGKESKLILIPREI